jgi:hypothetical protein
LDKSKRYSLCDLSPSVSNGIIGNLGERELINRAQLTLANMTVQVSAGRYLVEGILNPSNIDATNTTFSGLNNIGGGFQPSFSQFSTSPRYNGETTGGVTSSLFGSTGGFTSQVPRPHSLVLLLEPLLV